jgi:hypothetical protein
VTISDGMGQHEGHGRNRVVDRIERASTPASWGLVQTAVDAQILRGKSCLR